MPFWNCHDSSAVGMKEWGGELWEVSVERFTGAGPPKPSDCAGMRGIKGRSDAAPSSAAPPLSSEFNKSRAARVSLVRKCWVTYLPFSEASILPTLKCCDTEPSILLGVLDQFIRTGAWLRCQRCTCRIQKGERQKSQLKGVLWLSRNF